MRYLDSDPIVYIDKSTKRFEMIDFPDIETLTGREIKLGSIRDLDFLALQLYGSEDQWYKLFDANSPAIVENNYSIGNLNTLIVPV